MSRVVTRRPIETLSVDLGDPRPPTPAHHAEAYALEAALRSHLNLGALTSPRSTQGAVGMSEAGRPCDRQLAHRLAGTRPVNLTDPGRALVGTGTHHALAEVFGRLDGGSGRFEVERRVNYRGVPGTVDLYDRVTGTVVDWKTTTAGKLKRVRHDGPRVEYVTQVNLYAAALDVAGESVAWVALAYLPVDGTLADLWVWRARYDRAVADAAVARLDSLRMVDHPSTVAASPGPLCPWCPYYRPHVPASRDTCPGSSMEVQR